MLLECYTGTRVFVCRYIFSFFSANTSISEIEKKLLLADIQESATLKLKEEFTSVYKIQNVVKKDLAFKYVPPQEKTTTGFPKMHPNQPITIKYQFVPISETLKQLLSDPGFRLETSKTTAEEGFLKDVKDGRSYMENSYFQQNKEAFTLILVSDDFEISNPLGARKGCYKVNNLYWTIAEIPKHQR